MKNTAPNIMLVLPNFPTDRRLQRPLLICLLPFLLAHAGQASAKCDASFDDLLKMPFNQLFETEVNVASKVSTDPAKQPASVTVISREQLQLSAARTLSEALMTYVPGYFTVEDQDDTIASFRGLAPDNNSKALMLLNGHNLNAEWFMGPPDAILNSNNFDWIERIEVIRGPGSVTLGQGALLGVINIVTRKAEHLAPNCGQTKANLMAGAGLNNAWQGGGEWAVNDLDYDAYLHIQESDYAGQALRREGWAVDKAFLGDAGGVIADAGHRLKRADNLSLFGHLRYHQINVDLLHVDQTRDLYNLYRDRDQLEQAITYVGLSHNARLTENIELQSKGDVAVDDYTLHSINGDTVTGGTQENRYGLQEVLRLNNLWQGNTLALGAEFHAYDFGLANDNGGNFFLNSLAAKNQSDPAALNQDYTYVYPNTVEVYSLFAEDNYQISPSVTLFGGLRYDEHRFWGGNVSPRLGAFYYPWQDGQFRLSYQQGFRGAVGINYSGCCRHDGFLREGNFDQVNAAQLPGYDNLQAVRPEKLHNLELAFNQRFNAHWRFENVLFYNRIENIIDVGVIYGDRFSPPITLPPLGSDVPGTSNNYWFFKNNNGSIEQLGTEASLHYATGDWDVSASHSFVEVMAASSQNIGSMYVTKDQQQKASPQNVTRLNVIWRPLEQLSLSANYLHYSDWSATTGLKADGGNLLNASASYRPWRRLELIANVKNILGENNLYPMNNNANGFVSPGTPALETTTFWFTARLELL